MTKQKVRTQARVYQKLNGLMIEARKLYEDGVEVQVLLRVKKVPEITAQDILEAID